MREKKNDKEKKKESRQKERKKRVKFCDTSDCQDMKKKDAHTRPKGLNHV